MKLFCMVLALGLSASFVPLRATPVGFAELRERYLQEIDHHSERARRTLLEIGRLGDPEAIPFLREAFRHPPMYLGYGDRYFPGRNFHSEGSIAGIAQVALAMLGDEERWAELEAEATSLDVSLRLNALAKIKHVPGARAIELLSSFLGDREVLGDKIYLAEWGALFELSKRLDNPPYPVKDLSDLHPGYYSDGGEAKWLRWRYENYGPIPGREELFAGFENAPEAKTDPVPARVTGAPKTDRAPTREPQPAGQPTAEPSHEADATAAPAVAAPPPHRWWPWLGGLVLLGVAALWLRRFGARG